MPKPEYDFFVYILASRSHQFYVGFTNGLHRRIIEHREHRPGTYTARYHIDRLVYYEHHQYVLNAIHREKVIKKLSREKKITLIESVNPTWEDLSLKWDDPTPVMYKEPKPPTADLSAALRDDNKVEMAAAIPPKDIEPGQGTR
jgi:putative endonuclease